MYSKITFLSLKKTKEALSFGDILVFSLGYFVLLRGP
jgi:hypothetical protein